MADAISPGRLGEDVAEALASYSDAVVRAVNEETRQSAARLVRATKATAPVGSSRTHYRSKICSRLLRESPTGDTYVWLVGGSKYRLSHLLERDHATGGPANRGRARGTHFIAAARGREAVTYARRVREAIARASR